MGLLLGYSLWGYDEFSDDSTSLGNIKYAEFKNSIVDEISLRSKTDQGVSNIKEGWQNDYSILAKFTNSLESGNINNDGVKIVKFRIVRRESDKTSELQLGEVNYDGINNDLEFIDSTQPNRNLIYTVIPVGENGLDGVPKEIECDSSFTGYWIVDKDTNEILSFDKAIGSIGNVETTYTQDRAVIETFSKYPQVYYSNPEGGYHSFTLSATFLPEDWERSGDIYLNVLNNFIKQHKPFLIKGDNGSLYVADLSNLRSSTPNNTWKGYDYTTISIDCMEIMDVDDYFEEG